MADINSTELNEVSGGANLPASGRYISYIVKSGDCLSLIAKRYGTTVELLVQINGIKDPDLIYAGETIYIPVS